MDTRASLLLRIKDPRDSQAWSEFDTIYRPLLFRYARSQGLSDADAEDEVQRCMTAIQQIMSDFSYDPRKGRFKGWLRTMINNRCRNHHRDRQARLARLQAAQERKETQQETPEDVFDRIWMEEHLKHGLRSLREEVDDLKYKAFEQYVINERPVKEVSAELELTAQQLYKIKFQLTQKLREHIAALLKGRGGCVSNYELQRYHAQDLTREAAKQVEKHLEACGTCAEKNSRLLANHNKVCTLLRGLDFET